MIGAVFFMVLQIPAVFAWLWICGHGEFGQGGSLDPVDTALLFEGLAAAIALLLSAFERR